MIVIVVLLWSVLAALSIVQSALIGGSGDGGPGWPAMIALRLTDWYSCLLFVPGLVWLTHRFPIRRGRWRRSATILFVSSAVFVVAKYAIMLPVIRALSRQGVTTFGHLLASNALIELIIFWAVIAVALAYDFHRQLDQERQAAELLHGRLAAAQLDALDAQLQPHFLFNTLNAIGTLLHRDPDAADQMIARLAELLRLTLERGSSHEIPLETELDILGRYLGIMQVRFSDRLTVQVDVDPGCRDILVPRLLLQPLVENALEHGIARRAGPGVVRITAARRGDQLELSIEDDGPGLALAAHADGGIGLTNTRARLLQLYGAVGRLTLDGSMAGTIATVSLPWRTAGAPQ